MAEFPAPLLTVSILLPLVAVFTVKHPRARSIAIGAASATLILLLEVLRRVGTASGATIAEPWALPLLGAREAWFAADGLTAVPMVLFAALTLVTLIAAPRRDLDERFLKSVLTLSSAAIAAYAATNLIVFLAAWIVSAAVSVLQPATGRRMNLLVSGASTALVGAAVILIGIANSGAAAPLSIAGLRAAGASGGTWMIGCLVLAAVMREGLFPFHRATVATFHGGSLLLGTLVMNSHLGAFLMARIAMPLFPEIREVLPWLGALALFTALYAGILGIAERQPRRLLAMLAVSQSAAILAGLATASHEGIAGALLQWIALGISSTMLIAAYRGVEARVDVAFTGPGFLGLAARAPRLAVFFAIGGLTMVGLPGTLGFPGEDLLLHGVLAGYSWWGAALPLAIALNAYHVFRLFARLFLGRDTVTQKTAVDALPRERWALAACLAVLVWGGLAPQQVINLQAAATNALTRNAEVPPKHESKP